MAKKRMIVEAGPRARHDVPMRVPFGRHKKAKLADEATGRVVPCQILRGDLCFILDYVAAGEEKAYTVQTGRGSAARAPGVGALRKGNTVSFTVGGRPFTDYNFGKQWARPFFHPVIGPDRVQITRNYPIIERVPGETADHPHHKSLWVAHGDLNGVDNWSEGKKHGRQVSKRVKDVVDGPVAAMLRQDLEWVSTRGKKVLDEEREVRVWLSPPDQRILDLSITFRAKNGKVVFGDTKEGGLCSVRVATSMDGTRGGTLENAYGGIGEAEVWGQRAAWCDYCGPVNGKLVGIAIFDTPGNLRYPTYWHARDYGLMTANPFGISHFCPDSGQRGDYTLPANAVMTFRYRIYMHLGDVARGHVRDRFLDYVNPPKVRLDT